MNNLVEQHIQLRLKILIDPIKTLRKKLDLYGAGYKFNVEVIEYFDDDDHMVLEHEEIEAEEVIRLNMQLTNDMDFKVFDLNHKLIYEESS